MSAPEPARDLRGTAAESARPAPATDPEPARVLLGAVMESMRSARAQPVSTFLVAAAVLLTVGTATVTAGQSLQAERDAIATVDSAVTTTVEVLVVDGPGASGEEIAALAGVSSVEWVVGFAGVRDLWNPAAGDAGPVPGHTVVTALPAALVTVEGRPARPGEALVGVGAQGALGLTAGVGGLVARDQRDIPIVGALDASAPLDELASGVTVVADPDEGTRARRLLVQAASADQIAEVSGIVAAQLTADGDRRVEIGTDERLATLRSAVAGDLARGSREVLAAVTAAGALVVATVVLASVQSRRKDLGRRRALGASRPLVTGLLVGQTTVAALIGGAVAVVSGAAAAPLVEVGFAVTVAITVIAVASAAVASVPPAVVAASRDPVRVLRTP